VFLVESAGGTSAGGRLYASNCASCHGFQGEGGPNPARPGDIIAPISTSEYLRTRDDSTLYSIISQGQPNFGMSPFGSTFGGPLSDEELKNVVAFIRSWEANPPVEIPAELGDVPSGADASASEIFRALCVQCHGEGGVGGIGPALDDPDWQASVTDEDLATEIDQGHPATVMIAWGEILTASQIADLVTHIRGLTGTSSASSASGDPSYATDVAPIFAAKCAACHGASGGWSAASYNDVLLSGASGPTVVPGDADASSLYQSLVGTHPRGVVMPPGSPLSQGEIDIIGRWIDAGALE
jgi:mono/diheme cytochrome c family protein